MTIQWLCRICHRPIKPGTRPHKANCQCKKPGNASQPGSNTSVNSTYLDLSQYPVFVNPHINVYKFAPLFKYFGLISNQIIKRGAVCYTFNMIYICLWHEWESSKPGAMCPGCEGITVLC